MSQDDRSSFETLAEQLAQIEAFVPIAPQLATSGQPTAAQFAAIKASGYGLVINLAMPTSSNWLPEEPDVLAQLGLDYLHIPVLWENPILNDFAQICDAIAANQERKIWIHCAKNMRVSAMMYLYQRLEVKLAHDVAWRYVEQVWQPNPVWRDFIEATLELYGE
jgi:protein tyrosine phosphatase (PTP) superfamily phosphohydrolase (DUF442 family)